MNIGMTWNKNNNIMLDYFYLPIFSAALGFNREINKQFCCRDQLCVVDKDCANCVAWHREAKSRINSWEVACKPCFMNCFREDSGGFLKSLLSKHKSEMMGADWKGSELRTEPCRLSNLLPSVTSYTLKPPPSYPSRIQPPSGNPWALHLNYKWHSS